MATTNIQTFSGDVDVTSNILMSGEVFIKTNDGNGKGGIGVNAGLTSQGTSAVAVGQDAGQTDQGSYAVAVGVAAGGTSQGIDATAVGYAAGSNNQGSDAVAVGVAAGRTSQGTNAVAVGNAAGSNNQGDYAIAVGNSAGRTSQGGSAVAVGVSAGNTSQGSYATAVGNGAGDASQGVFTIAVGSGAGRYNQGDRGVAVGAAAGNTSQSNDAVAVGYIAGQTSQGTYATAVGNLAGQTSQGVSAVAVGNQAGETAQSDYATAVGFQAGETSQGVNSVAMGNNAAQTAQGSGSVAVGYQSGNTSQGASSVAVGQGAARFNQGSYATAVGRVAGQSNQGSNAVAVGYLAGQTNQHANSIILNASGSALDTEGTGRTYIKPLRVATVASNVMTYDQATGEVMDSGGLISNKLAIVSEQPPVALTGDSTVVDGHGRYKVTASLEAGSYQAWKCFNKSIDNADSGWSTGAVGAYNSDGTYAGSNVIAGVSGEWVKIEFPYKTTLRHVSLSPNVYYSAMPENFSIVASNDDSNWTVIKSVTGQAWTSADYVNFVINAGVAYKYYAIVAQLTNTNYAYIGEWKLFTETFTVDAGVVSTTAASGLDVGFTEHPVEPMTDYHTYVEGHGTYEASASSYDSTYSLYPWETFDNNTSTRWTISTDDDNYNVSTGEWDQTAIDASPDVFTSDVGGTRYHGHWLQIKLPYTVTLSHTNIHPQTIERAPKDGVILGSNDGEAWYKLTEFSGKTYTASTWTRIDVNATTPYQYYRMCATKNGGDSKLELTEWRLFAEKPVTRMENVHISGDLSSETLQTGYIKWPKVPLKANESEGYVVSASGVHQDLSIYQPYHAFEDKGEYVAAANPCWASDQDSFALGLAQNSRTTGEDTFNHEWIQIQMPRRIQLAYFLISSRLDRPEYTAPKSGYMYASNDGVTWTKIHTFSGVTSYVDDQNVRFDVSSTTAYSYFRLAVTETAETGTTYKEVFINELQLFEAATGVGAAPTSAKLQVAGSLGMAKGAEFFAGDDVVMELPKHDRPLTKYPEIPITSSANIDGYLATASSYVNREAWQAFDNSVSTSWTSNYGYTNLIGDEYLQLQLPVAIKVVKMYIKAYDSANYQLAPRDTELLGSIDGTTWVSLNTSTGLPLESRGASTWVHVNATHYYKYLRLRITKTYEGATNYARVADLQYWGYEEGDTSVDVVHKSIPNKPGQQHLEVYWDANDSNSYSFANSTKVYDLSGSGVTGTITGNNGFDAEYNAWEFDGSGDYISGTLNTTTGAGVHSF